MDAVGIPAIESELEKPMQIVSTIGLITINETLVVQLISFLIFLFIMNRLMFRPLRGVMAQRDEYVQKVEADIKKAEEKLKDILTQLKERETDIKKEAWSQKKEWMESGYQEADSVLMDVRKEMDTLTSVAEKEVCKQLEEARKSILIESEILAQSVMEKILDRRLAS